MQGRRVWCGRCCFRGSRWPSRFLCSSTQDVVAFCCTIKTGFCIYTCTAYFFPACMYVVQCRTSSGELCWSVLGQPCEHAVVMPGQYCCGCCFGVSSAPCTTKGSALVSRLYLMSTVTLDLVVVMGGRC